MIYQLPLSLLLAEAVPTKEHVRAELTQSGIDMRIDWDGVSPQHARFEVQLGLDEWHQVPNPQTTPKNDVVSPEQPIREHQLLVRLERGPDYSQVPFQVRALPITWRHDDVQLNSLLADNAEYIARRDVDYAYAEGCLGRDEPWIDATMIDGIQQVTIPLMVGTDYELWVNMQSPTNSKVWLEQDPIIRTHGSGGGSTGEDPL